MSYEVSTVTLKGAQLLASATAADKLILVGCDANTTIYTKAQAVAIETRPVSPTSTTTDVFLEGATQNHVFCRAIFTAGSSTSANVNSLLLYGHRESEPNDNYVIAVLSSSSTAHIPAVGEPANTYSTLFDIVYNLSADTVGTVDSSLYATHAEIERLQERVVTTHKDGDWSTGDNQNILGYKAFKTFPLSIGDYTVVDGQSFVDTPFVRMKNGDNGVLIGNYNDNVNNVTQDYFQLFSTDTQFKDFDSSVNCLRDKTNNFISNDLSLTSGTSVGYFRNKITTLQSGSLVYLTGMETSMYASGISGEQGYFKLESTASSNVSASVYCSGFSLTSRADTTLARYDSSGDLLNVIEQKDNEIDCTVYLNSTDKNTYIFSDESFYAVATRSDPLDLGAFDLGNENHNWNQLWCTHIKELSGIQSRNNDQLVIDCNSVATSYAPYEVVTTIKDNGSALGSIKFDRLNGSNILRLYPDNANFRLGDSSNPWETVYCNNINSFGSVLFDSNSYHVISGRLDGCSVTCGNINIGTNSYTLSREQKDSTDPVRKVTSSIENKRSGNNYASFSMEFINSNGQSSTSYIRLTGDYTGDTFNSFATLRASSVRYIGIGLYTYCFEFTYKTIDNVYTGVFIPNQTDSCYIGTSDKHWKTAYINNVYANAVNTASLTTTALSVTTVTASTIQSSTNMLTLKYGTDTDTIYFTQAPTQATPDDIIVSALCPTTTDTTYLGTSYKRWDEVFARYGHFDYVHASSSIQTGKLTATNGLDIYGKLDFIGVDEITAYPHQQNSKVQVNAGGIVVASDSHWSGTVYHVGDQLVIDDNSYHPVAASLTGSVSGSSQLCNGTYVFLSEVASSDTIALLQRIK